MLEICWRNSQVKVYGAVNDKQKLATLAQIIEIAATSVVASGAICLLPGRILSVDSEKQDHKAVIIHLQ